jgi:hypothetical protein
VQGEACARVPFSHESGHLRYVVRAGAALKRRSGPPNIAKSIREKPPVRHCHLNGSHTEGQQPTPDPIASIRLLDAHLQAVWELVGGVEERMSEFAIRLRAQFRGIEDYRRGLSQPSDAIALDQPLHFNEQVEEVIIG